MNDKEILSILGVDPDSQNAVVYLEIARTLLQSKQVQEWKQDSEYVDWLDDVGGAVVQVFFGSEWEICSGDILGCGNNIRDAFDDAMMCQKALEREDDE